MIETEVDEYRLDSETSKYSLHISIINNEKIAMILIKKLTNQRYSSYLSLQSLKQLSNAFININNIKDALTILKNTIESQNITLIEFNNDSLMSINYKIYLDNIRYLKFKVNLTLEGANNNMLNTQNHNFIFGDANANINNIIINQTIPQINYWTCPKCHQFMEEKLKSDHILSHEIYEADQRLSNSSRPLNIRHRRYNNAGEMRNENNSRNQIQYTMNNNNYDSRPYQLNRNRNVYTINNNEYSTSNNDNYYSRPYQLNRNTNVYTINNNEHQIPNNDHYYLNDNNNIYLRPNNENIFLNKRRQSSLPEFVIEDINKLEETNRKCMICLDEFISKEKVTALPCVHFFHPKCIQKWVEKKNECPICKFVLTEENIYRKLKYG